MSLPQPLMALPTFLSFWGLSRFRPSGSDWKGSHTQAPIRHFFTVKSVTRETRC